MYLVEGRAPAFTFANSKVDHMSEIELREFPQIQQSRHANQYEESRNEARNGKEFEESRHEA